MTHSGGEPTQFPLLSGPLMDSIMLVAFSTTRPPGFRQALTLPGLYLSLLVKTRVVRGRLLHTSTIFRNIPLDSFVLKWQLEAARWFPKDLVVSMKSPLISG